MSSIYIYIYRVYNSICLLSFGITGHQGAIYTELPYQWRPMHGLVVICHVIKKMPRPMLWSAQVSWTPCCAKSPSDRNPYSNAFKTFDYVFFFPINLYRGISQNRWCSKIILFPCKSFSDHPLCREIPINIYINRLNPCSILKTLCLPTSSCCRPGLRNAPKLDEATEHLEGPVEVCQG